MSVPPGFYEMLECEDTDSAFVRGVLQPMEAIEAIRARGGIPVDELRQYPRWTLYGGPLSTRQEARNVSMQVQLWAKSYGLWWWPDSEACIVPARVWGFPHESFKWEWVWESRPPSKLTLVYDPHARANLWRWA